MYRVRLGGGFPLVKCFSVKKVKHEPQDKAKAAHYYCSLKIYGRTKVNIGNHIRCPFVVLD